MLQTKWLTLVGKIFLDGLGIQIGSYTCGMECKKCHSFCIKWGKQTNGRQRYYCKSCRQSSQLNYTYKAKTAEVHRNFRKFQRFGVSYRLMAKFLGISRNTLSRWILKALKLTSKEEISIAGVFEIDEVRTYAGSKESEIWITYGWSVSDRKPVGLKVGKRSKEELSPVVKEVLQYHPQKIKTDGFATYKALIPRRIHSTGRHLANHIERNHINLRKDIGFLIRRTICYAKSVQMLEARIRWCFWGNADPDFFLERGPKIGS